MKGKEIIDYAIRGEMPDMENVRKNAMRQAAGNSWTKHSTVKSLASAVVCIIIILAVIAGIPRLYGNAAHDINNINAPGTSFFIEASNSPSNDSDEPAIRGLPVENFTLAQVESGIAESMTRIGFMSFESFFDWKVDCFVIVKVENIQTMQDGTSIDKQISELTILENVYGECGENSIQVMQGIIENHFCLGTANLLRQGGAYLLPLKQYDDIWCIMGDLDVLFEIDDLGKVWSHSEFGCFNLYDGEDVEFLIEKLPKVFSDRGLYID